MRTIILAASLLVAGSTAAAQDISARLDSAMRVAVRAGFSGVVRIEKEGRVLLDKGYGLANHASKIPFTPQTVVQIGSNTKDITAVAMLQLQASGKLSLNDSIENNLGDITIEKIETFDRGRVEMKLRSLVQGAATLKVTMTTAEPYQIQGMQIVIGG